MTAADAEIGDRFEVDDRVRLPELHVVAGVASVLPVVRHDLETAYYDTADLALASHLVSLRRRDGADDPGWRLSLPQGDHRADVRLPLGPDAAHVPEELRSLLRGLTRDAQLRPVVATRTHRDVHRLLDTDGRALANVYDDHVEAALHAVGARPPSSRRWREWEVELLEGDEHLVNATAELFTLAGATPVNAVLKLARALASVIPEDSNQPELGKKSRASDVIQARLASQVTRMRQLDPLVRHDAPDAVHQMRVAMRRLRSALATYRPLLERDVTDPVRDELKWLGQVLGEARDAEVMRERLSMKVAAERAENVRGPVLARIDRDLGDRYRQAHTKSLHALSSVRYFDLLDALDTLVAHPPFAPCADEPAIAVLPGRVRHDWKRAKRGVAVASSTRDATARADRLHEVRKAIKRTRYAAEPLTGIFGKKSKRFVKAMKDLQTLLGEHHDSIVSRGHLLRLADHAVDDGHNAFTFGLLYAREEAVTMAAEARFPTAWERASEKRLRNWIP